MLRCIGVSKHVYFSMETSPSIQVNDAVVQHVESEGGEDSVDLVAHKHVHERRKFNLNLRSC